MNKLDKNSQKIKKTKKEKHKVKKDQKKANIKRFFENEAEVGSDDSDDYGVSNNRTKKNVKDYYYKDQDLKQRTRGINLDELEQKALRREAKRDAKEKELQKKMIQDNSDS